MKKFKNIADCIFCILLMFLVACILGGSVPGFLAGCAVDIMLYHQFLQYNIRKYPIYGYLENSMFPVNPTKPYCF